jgi:toxin FitB
MRGFLLDTDVISLLSAGQDSLSEAFLEWLAEMDERGRIFISSVAIHEIEKGIALLERTGQTSRVALTQVWLTELIAEHAERILGIDTATASVAGHLEARALSTGHTPRMADAMMAGTAVMHDLVIISMQPRPFLSFGVTATLPHDALTCA